MEMYSIVNFLHVAGSIGIIIALMFERLMMMRLLKTASPDHFGAWREISGLPAKIGVPSVIISLLTGIYLATAAWPRDPWVWMSLAALIVVAIIGAVFNRNSQGVLTEANSNREIGSHWGKMWLSLQLRTGLVVGILFLMVVKPDFGVSLFSLLLFTFVFSVPVAFYWKKYQPLRHREV